MIRQIPNFLSLFRLLVSIALLFHFRYPALFVTEYFLCGITDVIDGYLARRCKWETRLGRQLDSLSDAVFYIVILYLSIFHMNLVRTPWVLISIAIVIMIRVINFILTRVKFKTWGAMHTWGNKVTGLLFYLYLPVALIHNTIWFIPGFVICFLAVASSIEETIILLTSHQYDANRRSCFINR